MEENEVVQMEVGEVIERLISRVLELEQRQVGLERRHLEQAGELRTLAIAAKQTADSLESSHAGNQAAFSRIADSLARLALERGPNPGGDVN